MTASYFAIRVSARKSPLPVFDSARLLRVMATIRRDLFYVESHYAFAAAFPFAPTLWTNIVFATTLNYAYASRYSICSGQPNCDYGHICILRVPPFGAAPSDADFASSVQYDVWLKNFREYCPELHYLQPLRVLVRVCPYALASLQNF